MFTNKKNFLIALSTAIFVFVGLIAFAVPVNGQASNLITSFKQGNNYPYDAPNGTKTLTTSGNNINPAIETRGNVGGAVSNYFSLTAGKQYTLTYTYTLNPTNPAGTAPNIRFVSDTSGRGNIYLTSNGVTRILDHTAQSGTKSVVFTPLTTGGYIEVSVGSGSKTNFSMTNISVTLTPAPTVTISANPTTVAYNSSSNISWTSTNATSCSVTKAGTAWQTGVSGTNVSSGALTANTTFTATCTGVGGTGTGNVTVSVAAPPIVVTHSTTFNLTVTAPPDLYHLSLSKTCTAVVLNWDVVPGATSYEITRITGSGTASILPPVTGTTYTDTTAAVNTLWTYTVKANNATVSKPQSIDNTKDPSCIPPLDPSVEILADPMTGPSSGYTSEVSWTSKDVTSCDLSTVGGEKGDDWSGYVGPVPVADIISGTVTEDMTFNISCRRIGGGPQVTDRVSVTVTDDNNGGGGNLTGTCTAVYNGRTFTGGDTINISNPPGTGTVTFTANPIGGTSPYSYIWPGGNTTRTYSKTFTSIGSNTTALTIRDASSNTVNSLCPSVFVGTNGGGGSTLPLLWFEGSNKPTINTSIEPPKTVREGQDVVVKYDRNEYSCTGLINLPIPTGFDITNPEWLQGIFIDTNTDIDIDDNQIYKFRNLVKGKYVVNLKCSESTITKTQSSWLANVVSSLSSVFAQSVPAPVNSNTLTINVVKPTIEEI